jgi:sec-independent protein translocase protein TatA
MGNIGFPELLVILVVVLLVFGPGKLPEIGSSLGRAIGEFKKGFREESDKLADSEAALQAEQKKAPE